MLSRKQEFELITAIKGRGEIPLKFAYLGKGSKNWDRIAKARTKEKGINYIETKLLKEKVKLFLDAYKNNEKINVVDIGCGNGTPVFPILEFLAKRKIKFRYIPVDISKEMISVAKRNIKKKFGNVKGKEVLLDFEQGNFSDVIYEMKKDGSKNLLLFLGSTLGNHDDRIRVLTNFRDSMTSEDYLIIGVELTNIAKISKILPYYKDRLSKKFLYFIPEKIGIKRRDTDYIVEWNEGKKQVEVKIKLKKNVYVKIGKEKFKLEKDEQILLARSIKFTEWSITKLLSETGFRNELLTTSKDRGYILSMVQPTRYSL